MEYVIINIIRRIRKLRAIPSMLADVEENVEIPARINIATKSCTIKKPIEILPWSELISFLSDNNFTIIIVLLKVSAIAIKADSISENPKASEIIIPIKVVKTICPTPVTIDIFPISLNTLTSSFIPTRKSKKAIPISENITKRS